MYPANSLTSVRPLNPKSPAAALGHPSPGAGGRVRSKHPSSGTKSTEASGLAATFGSNPEPAQFTGSLIVGSPAGAKFPGTVFVMQGAFTLVPPRPPLKPPPPQ